MIVYKVVTTPNNGDGYISCRIPEGNPFSLRYFVGVPTRAPRAINRLAPIMAFKSISTAQDFMRSDDILFKAEAKLSRKRVTYIVTRLRDLSLIRAFWGGRARPELMLVPLGTVACSELTLLEMITHDRL